MHPASRAPLPVAATSGSGHCCGCGVPWSLGLGYARLRSWWRSPVRAKIDEVEFRPPDRRKLRLQWWRLRRLSPRDLAADAGAALRHVPPAAAAPVLLAVPLAAARLALPKNAARQVPYSDLVAGLREWVVSAVAFEEDSHRIYFSRKDMDDDGSGANYAGESAGAATKWSYYARRVPHDEGFLLGLMREGGVDYWSSPRPAGRLLVDMLSTLLTLWVSLLPMMWFIRRQMSSGGGAEKRRSPRKQRVLFDDVQSVDEAKEELVEVNNATFLCDAC
jgi:hypothetical protein